MSNNASARDAFRRVTDKLLALGERLGARTTRVTVVVEQYSGPTNLTATTLTSTTSVVLSPVPRVQRGTATEGYFGGGSAALSAGKVPVGQYLIGPIALPYTAGGGGGYSQAQLAPDGGPARRVYYLLEGEDLSPGGERFQLVSIDSSNPFATQLVVARTEQ